MDLWIFGYGSLMWNPGFACAEQRPALLNGYHRAAMMVSTRNRGTPDCPGMVVSLAPGGHCVGMGLRVAPGHETEALVYLDKREGVGRANKRVLVPLHWHDAPRGPAVHAWVYLPIITYCNYIWGVPVERQAELVARGCGRTGTSFDYVRRVVEHCRRLGTPEPALERLLAEARRHLPPDALPEDPADAAPTLANAGD